jgi:hypothetical protein
MLTTTRLVHRMLVDRLAETKWLKGRAGANASWVHYEHHARADAAARARAAAWHSRARARAERLASRRPPRLLRRLQEAIGGERARSETCGK